MKWGSQLKVPFEPGELVQVFLFRESAVGLCEPVIGEVMQAGEDFIRIRWGSHDEQEHHLMPWWSGPTLVRPVIRGYPYERKLSDFAWILFWIWYLPYRLRRRLFARSVGKGGKLW